VLPALAGGSASYLVHAETTRTEATAVSNTISLSVEPIKAFLAHGHSRLIPLNLVKNTLSLFRKQD
jgi:hypothetical protein